MNPCIITGCDLVVISEGDLTGRAVHGDLFRIGECYVFNAVVDDAGEPAWLEPGEKASDRKIFVVNNIQLWERRGVFVFPVRAGNLNNEAYRYVHGKEKGHAQV